MTLSNIDYTETQINAVWNKGKIVANNNPNEFRKDIAGAWIARKAYGKSSEYGWQIDHIKPLAKGGSSMLQNLQPLQHDNNLNKSDNYPTWVSVVTAFGDHNISHRSYITQNWNS